MSKESQFRKPKPRSTHGGLMKKQLKVRTKFPDKPILLHGLKGLQKGRTEAWFVIESASRVGDGIYAREVFQDLPHGSAQSNNQRNFELYDEVPQDAYFLGEACCVQVGRYLYVLGGRDHSPHLYTEISDTVRRLDLLNVGAGWQACKPLPFPLGLSESCVECSLIYVFPSSRHGGGNADIPGGFIYNTIDQEVYDIVPPFGFGKFQLWNPPFCFYHDFGDGRKGVLLPVHSLVLYSQKGKCWDSVEKPELLKLEAREIKHAFSNGILYLSYWDWEYDWDYQDNPVRNRVCACCVQTGAHLFGDGIMVPAFKKLLTPEKVSFNMSLVAVADFKLRYLWSEPGLPASVFIATVVFSPERMSAFVSEKEILLNASWITNCIPLS